MKHDIKIFTDMIEQAAIDQIDRIAEMPAFEDAKICIMPDVHAGKGCVCGFTANLGDKVVPNLIGVDIGCAILTVKLGKIDIDFAELDSVIRRLIPSGKSANEEPVVDKLDADADPASCLAGFKDGELDYFAKSLSSLGGGNHFIEVDADKDGCKYLIIHCGSRNFGKKVCDYWQEIAVKEIAEKAVSETELDELIASL